MIGDVIVVVAGRGVVGGEYLSFDEV